MGKVKLPIVSNTDENVQRALRRIETELNEIYTAIAEAIDAIPSPVTITASNAGAGAGVFKNKVLNDLVFKSLVAGTNISITPGTDNITLATSAEINTASNVGSEKEVFKQKSGVDFQFRTLKAGTNVTLTQNTNDITIAATDTGEVNTSSNVGSGAQLAKTKSGVDLPFRSIVGGSGIAVTQNTNDITLDADSLVVGVGLGLFGSGVLGALVFDGSTTILGIAPSSVGSTVYRIGAVQRYILNRDLYCTNLTVNSGVLVFTDGYRIFVNGTLTLNGYIGQPGINGVQASLAQAQVARTDTILSAVVASGGGNSPAAGNATNVSQVPYPALSNTGSNAGTGNSGANGTAGTLGVTMRGGGGGGAGNASNSGSVGGQITAAANNEGAVHNILQLISGRQAISTTIRFSPATGGGGGASANGLSVGGSGGGGGAPVVVVARLVTGSGSIITQGGNGGGGFPITVGAASAGGGGGGAGCWLGCVINNGSFPTLDVSGGTGGAGGANNTNGFLGGNGGNGGNGFTITLKMSV